MNINDTMALRRAELALAAATAEVNRLRARQAAERESAWAVPERCAYCGKNDRSAVVHYVNPPDLYLCWQCCENSCRPCPAERSGRLPYGDGETLDGFEYPDTRPMV